MSKYVPKTDEERKKQEIQRTARIQERINIEIKNCYSLDCVSSIVKESSSQFTITLKNDVVYKMTVLAEYYPFRPPIIFRNNKQIYFESSPAMTLDKIILSLECESFDEGSRFFEKLDNHSETLQELFQNVERITNTASQWNMYDVKHQPSN